ncbi:hypothetical protein [Sphaerisporangium dianthi]|uniref:Uncharacterized protein n=1 Tax=Sphaerisporangium dianthi TaxID=1436120 RepID=A0ABV9CFZ2_9ACTN
MPPPPPPPAPSVFDPAPYGARSADPHSPGNGQQHYSAQSGREATTQTSFPPPPPLADPPFSPQPTGPQQYTPQPTGPQRYTPSPTGPQQYAPSPTGPQNHVPSTGPQRYTPSPTGPQQYSAAQAAQATQAAPPAYAPSPSGERQYAPSPTGPQGYTPSPSGPQQAAPAYAPPVTGPQHAPAAGAAYVPAGTETTMRVTAPAAPEQQQPARRHAAPPSPEDPYKPFVTAGQISGPKTPPPERQQELWNTVFGDNYEAIGEEADDAGNGRRVWLLALVASVVVALLAALLWAFLVGPLSGSGGDGSTAASGEATPKSTAKASSSGKGGTGTAKPQSIGRLPKYRGTASPRTGVLTDQAAGVGIARLGGPWRLDSRSEHIKSTYGYTTRQYVAAGVDSAGKPQFAQVMTGPLPEALASKYSAAEPDKLAPVISSVAFAARNKFFPAGNKVVKTAEQKVSAGGHPARLVAYQVMAGDAKTTLVVAAVSTGGDLPVVVYMSVPDSKKELLPDVNTVFSSIRPTTPAS